jgi:hypothetical protein
MVALDMDLALLSEFNLYHNLDKYSSYFLSDYKKNNFSPSFKYILYRINIHRMSRKHHHKHHRKNFDRCRCCGGRRTSEAIAARNIEVNKEVDYVYAQKAARDAYVWENSLDFTHYDHCYQYKSFVPYHAFSDMVWRRHIAAGAAF